MRLEEKRQVEGQNEEKKNLGETRVERVERKNENKRNETKKKI